jgi:hypothetical protein
MKMVYSIEIVGDGMSNIYQLNGHIYLCDGVQTVRVKSQEYHERMHRWTTEDRMQRPLVFVDGETSAAMVADGQNVRVEICKKS